MKYQESLDLNRYVRNRNQILALRRRHANTQVMQDLNVYLKSSSHNFHF